MVIMITYYPDAKLYEVGVEDYETGDFENIAWTAGRDRAIQIAKAAVDRGTVARDLVAIPEYRKTAVRRENLLKKIISRSFLRAREQSDAPI
jgi:hypothetical protein